MGQDQTRSIEQHSGNLWRLDDCSTVNYRVRCDKGQAAPAKRALFQARAAPRRTETGLCCRKRDTAIAGFPPNAHMFPI